MANLDLNALLDRLRRGEDTDLEFKSARGGIPRSLWETYSAMANSEGGLILLGVENDGRVSPGGLADVGKLKRDLFNTLQNRGAVSANLLCDTNVWEETTSHGSILVLQVPRATRQERPVYIGQNPLTGTFRRTHEGDYRCSEQEVGRMLADRDEESRDGRILEHFSLEDLDRPSLQQYRQRFSSRVPSHPWLSEDDIGLLMKLGGWRRDRASGKSGPTLAGLLMFGRSDAIREAVPGYHLDYREYLSPDPADRWTDRLTTDGTWESNLYRFFIQVIGRLSADIKLPFQLDADMVRQGESAVHVAIREALVNSLIHADYSGQGGIVLEKRRESFEFSNPGTLLISREQLRCGGVSECRNKSLQSMFLQIGAAEKAGSGLDKIMHGWQTQHWRLPSIEERLRPDRVVLKLPMTSLIPDESLSRLRQLFGREVQDLDPSAIAALVTADTEGMVSNGRLCQIRNIRPAEATELLRKLVSQGFLESDGKGRWTTYCLPLESERETDLVSLLEEVPSLSVGIPSSGGIVTGSGAHIPESHPDILDSERDIPHSRTDIQDSRTDIQDSGKDIQDLGDGGETKAMWRGFEAELVQLLYSLAKAGRPRIPAAALDLLILKLCQHGYLTGAQLAELLARNEVYLQQNYLSRLVASGHLVLRYPEARKRPGQAYKTAKRLQDA